VPLDDWDRDINIGALQESLRLRIVSR